MKIVYGALIISSIIISTLYYSHESYGFNAELIVAICFTVFVLLTIKSINNALTSSMKDRSDQIKDEYNNLQSTQEESLKLLISYYKKYNQLVNTLKQLFIYSVSKGFEMHLQRKLTSINNASVIILNGFNTITLLENIYILKYKYNFISRFYQKLSTQYKNNNTEVLEYLASINYINTIGNSNNNNKFIKNINIITTTI